VHPEVRNSSLLRRGRGLEWATLLWNVIGVGVLVVLVLDSRSIALLGFGLDSLIEIGASIVVLWELSGTGIRRQRRALKLIAIAFAALSVYLLVQSTLALIDEHHATALIGGVAWTAVTAVVMFSLAAGKTRVGRLLGNPVLVTEGRVTFVDGVLATSVLAGVLLDGLFGWWWADSLAAYVIVFYAARECITIFRDLSGCRDASPPMIGLVRRRSDSHGR
jgi:divalent metal cation (Fe/Co/Zn/Cd) transporter